MPIPSSSSVAVIDIGSNSIKLLVAARNPDGSLKALANRSIDARISAGIGGLRPLLGPEGMDRGLAAIRNLLQDASAFSPSKIVLVATSAVRGAGNGDEFRERVRAATGQAVRILSGGEEAALIGRGLTCDPALADRRDFYVFDLGGGSLECLAFRNRVIDQALSLPLGCVRLAEKFVADASAPLLPAERAAIDRHVHEAFGQSGFAFSLPAHAAAIGTGGTLATVRAIAAAREGRTFESSGTLIGTGQLRDMLDWLGGLSLEDRKAVPGLPSARADVFPTALATIIALADAGGFDRFQNSLYNLRWGVAAEALASAE